MLNMRPHVYQAKNGSSPYIIISGILCLSMILWMSWLGDLLANFLFAGSGQSGNGQGGQGGKKEGKKDPPAPNKTKSKGKRKIGIDIKK